MSEQKKRKFFTMIKGLYSYTKNQRKENMDISFLTTVFYTFAAMKPFKNGMSTDEFCAVTQKYHNEIYEKYSKRVTRKVTEKYQKKLIKGKLTPNAYVKKCHSEIFQILERKLSLALWWDFYFGKTKK